MDYRTLLTVPLAALALSANGAGTLRQPDGWTSGATYQWPDGDTHEAGIAPETEASGQRALTVKSKGEASINLTHVARVDRSLGGMEVRLKDGRTTLPVSQSFQQRFKPM